MLDESKIYLFHLYCHHLLRLVSVTWSIVRLLHVSLLFRRINAESTFVFCEREKCKTRIVVDSSFKSCRDISSNVRYVHQNVTLGP